MGKDHAVKKAISQATAIATERHVGIDHLLSGEALLAEMSHKRPTPRRKTQPVRATHCPTHTARRKIRTRTVVFATHEQRVVKRGRLLTHVNEA